MGCEMTLRPEARRSGVEPEAVQESSLVATYPPYEALDAPRRMEVRRAVSGVRGAANGAGELTGGRESETNRIDRRFDATPDAAWLGLAAWIP